MHAYIHTYIHWIPFCLFARDIFGSSTMGAEFRRDVEHFAAAVQRHIPNELLMPWLFANMPRAIPALNLGPGVKGEIGSCKQEADQPEASPRSEPEASPRSRPEASRPRSRPEASRPEASPRSSEGALTPPFRRQAPAARRDWTPPRPSQRPGPCC